MRMLLLAEPFYDYIKKIKNKFEKNGCIVDDFLVDFSRSFFSKVKGKIIKKYLYDKKRLIDVYNTIKEVNYDIVFVIVGRTLSSDFIKKIKEKNKDAIFILYLWDDVKRVQNYSNISAYFDEIYTFDRVDAIKYNLKFKPLFYMNVFEKKEKKYDLFFIGWNHSDRVEILKKIYDSNKDLKCYFKVFFTSQKQKKKYEGIIPSDWIISNPIPTNEVFDLMSQSRAVIDINFPTQNGLTMRTIETISSGVKLITTNLDIQNYDFYDNNMIDIISRVNPIVNRSFLTEDERTYKKDIIDNYSLENWCKSFIGGKHNE